MRLAVHYTHGLCNSEARSSRGAAAAHGAGNDAKRKVSKQLRLSFGSSSSTLVAPQNGTTVSPVPAAGAQVLPLAATVPLPPYSLNSCLVYKS